MACLGWHMELTIAVCFYLESRKLHFSKQPRWVWCKCFTLHVVRITEVRGVGEEGRMSTSLSVSFPAHPHSPLCKELFTWLARFGDIDQAIVMNGHDHYICQCQMVMVPTLFSASCWCLEVMSLSRAKIAQCLTTFSSLLLSLHSFLDVVMPTLVPWILWLSQKVIIAKICSWEGRASVSNSTRLQIVLSLTRVPFGMCQALALIKMKFYLGFIWLISYAYSIFRING